jgi:hypothetical protein
LHPTRAPGQVGPWTGEIEGAPEDYLFVIPDISGYTQLVAPSHFSITHAHHIIHDLLDAMIKAAAPFTPARIEGDAVLLYAKAADVAATPQAYSDAVSALFNAFDRQLARLRAENACPCAACERIDYLDLKIVAHRGPAVRFKIGAMEDFTGQALVEIHRLLKNDLGRKRYLLASDQAVALWPNPQPGPAVARPQHYPDIGDMPCQVFEAPQPNTAAAPIKLTGKLRDLRRKTTATLRAGVKRR